MKINLVGKLISGDGIIWSEIKNEFMKKVSEPAKMSQISALCKIADEQTVYY